MIRTASTRYEGWPDEELLQLLRKGDHDAFTELYHRFWKKLFFIAADKLDDAAEAEELVQDLFCELWQRREQLTVPQSCAAYLAVATRYKVLDRLALRARRATFPTESPEIYGIEDHSTQHRLQLEELQERLGKSLDQLPEKCRLVFVLSRQEGLTYRQIAGQMGIAEKTVEAHLSRALRTLRMTLRSFISVWLATL